MRKIGRNDPCLCGSGKKFKKCCMNKQAAQPTRIQGIRRIHWSPEEIDSFSTDEIVSKLRSFGIPFEKDQFLEDVKMFYSGEDLAHSWQKKHHITATGFDEDFFWMAAIVLWKRLAPDVISSERLSDMMEQGYRLLQENTRKKTMEACDIWLEVWEHLKPRFTADMKSIDDAERVFNGFQFLSNWCQDLEMELGNAGLDDPSFFEKRIRYCREFCELFPNSDELLLHNMKRAEAEAHFSLGREEEGERLFEALIRQFPDNAWGYIGWGDMYRRPMKDKGLQDVERAQRIYRMGLNPNVKNKEDILDRLRDLENE